MQTYESPLGQALAIWRQGKSIPIDLAAKLTEQGYDVRQLARFHRA